MAAWAASAAAALAAMRALTSGRRSGGMVAGGWRRAGSAASRCVVDAATSATAASNASRLPSFRAWMPLTLRMYCRAAASISVGGRDGLQPAELGDVSAHGLQDRRRATGLPGQATTPAVVSPGSREMCVVDGLESGEGAQPFEVIGPVDAIHATGAGAVAIEPNEVTPPMTLEVPMKFGATRVTKAGATGVCVVGQQQRLRAGEAGVDLVQLRPGDHPDLVGLTSFQDAASGKLFCSP